MKTAEKADHHSRVSIELKQIANEIGAERESCQRVDDNNVWNAVTCDFCANKTVDSVSIARL